jgi:hypothetical protein
MAKTIPIPIAKELDALAAVGHVLVKISRTVATTRAVRIR